MIAGIRARISEWMKRAPVVREVPRGRAGVVLEELLGRAPVCLVTPELQRFLAGKVVLVTGAGLCYLVNSFAVILSPAASAILFPAILLPAFVGELSLPVWLTVKGVHETKWHQLSAPMASPAAVMR